VFALIAGQLGSRRLGHASFDAVIAAMERPGGNPAGVAAKCLPLAQQLRAARPDMPGVEGDDRRFTNFLDHAACAQLQGRSQRRD